MRLKKKSALWALSVFLMAPVFAGCGGGEVDVYDDPSGSVGRGRTELGIDVLRANRYRGLTGRRVGLITNQTSRDGRGNKTRLVLHRARGVNLTALYVPVQGDEVDMALADYLNNIADKSKLQVMFIRLNPGVYSFGSKKVCIKVDNGKINAKRRVDQPDCLGCTKTMAAELKKVAVKRHSALKHGIERI